MSIPFNHYNWDLVECIEDPIYSFPVNKTCFFSTYETLLESLDGRDMSSFIDFFFEHSIVNKKILVFIDDDAKEDFRVLAEELKLIPELYEICEGESKDEKQERINNNNNNNQLSRCYDTIDKLTKELVSLDKKDINKITKIKEKISRTNELIKTLL